jgi:hypothetical protein
VQPERNSNLFEWHKIERWLVRNGYQVVFVPDTEAVLLGKEGAWYRDSDSPWCIPAAMNIDIRLALYELAEFNCFTTGGPMALAAFADCRYATFKMLSGQFGAEHLTAIGNEDGATRGEFRETYWCDDTYANVVGKLEPFTKIISNRNVAPVFDAQTHYRGQLIQPVANG